MVLLAVSMRLRPRDDIVHALVAHTVAVHARAARTVLDSIAGASRCHAVGLPICVALISAVAITNISLALQY